MRRGDDVLELEQRAVGARLLGEHVEPGRGDPALLQRGVERVLVDDPAAGGVDEDQVGAHLVQLRVADQAEGLGCPGQVHRHEVGLGEQGVEVDQADAHLRGPAGLDVGVVGDDVHAERREPVRHEDADPAEPDDADGLLVQLDAGVLRPLPLALPQRGVRRADVAGGGEHQRDGELGGGDDVGGRGVDDHHAGLGRRADVDVVEPDTGAGHDLEPRRGGERLGVDGGGAADQQRVGARQRGQQLGAVGAVAVPDLEVGPELLDGRRAQLLGDQDDRLAQQVRSERHRERQSQRSSLCRDQRRTTLCDRPHYPAGAG